MADLFGQLLELQWRTIGVPCASMELDLRQDLVIHKFADRDGAYIEGTGRAPLEVTARIPFINGLTAGANESWVEEFLYPTTWRRFFAACADKSSGTLQHPELGSILCKCQTARTAWSADVRGGVWVNMVWLETDDTGVDLEQDLSNPSPIAQIDVSATDLDGQINSINPALVPSLPTLGFSFSALSQAIRGMIDTTTILQKQIAGRLDNVIYQANAVENSLDMVANATPTNWPMYQSAERLKGAAYALKAQPLPPSRPVASRPMPKDCTLAQAASIVGASVADIITLNAPLVGQPYVPRGTPVSYYAQAA